MSAAIFSGGYAKILANLGIKLKDDTRILSGSVDPSVTNPSAPDGSIYLSSGFGLFIRKASTWLKLASSDEVVNTILIQTFEEAVLADFTQTGLELIASPFIHGKKTARLIHQAASDYSFKQVKSVDPKFRGKSNLFRMDCRSTADSANVTVLIKDETNNATLVSGTFTTGRVTAAVFNTNSNTTVNVTDLAILNSLKIGASISGAGIPTGTTITAIDYNTSALTISNAATATAAGVSLKVSSLPNMQSYAFDIPTNCASISYTITALQEAGLPETYVDDVVIELTEMAMTSTSVTVPALDIVQSSSLNQSASVGAANISGALTANSNTGIFSYNSGTGVYTVLKDAKFHISASLRALSASQVLPIININGVATTVSITPPSAANWTSTSWSGDLVIGDTFYISNSQNTTDIQRIYVSARTNPASETKTIPLSSSVIVTEPDSYLRITGFNANVSGSTATRIVSLASGTIQQTMGDALQYLDDSVNGARFIAKKEGLFRFQCSMDSYATNGIIGLSLNSVNLTTDVQNIPPSEKIAISFDGGNSAIGNVFGEVFLRVGDTVRLHRQNAPDSSTAAYSTFSASYLGSTKILNPSSDQKIDIPTHELRFEGASARGSVATAIVKFDTLAKIKGDGFEVVNTAADGTVVTIKKAGRLQVSCSLTGNAQTFQITKNQVTLTARSSTASEILAIQSIDTGSNYASASATVDVVVGDKIRVNSDQVATANASNGLTLSLQETSVAVALQNVAPRWDDSDSAVRLNTANGFGSTATKIRRFSNVVGNFGTEVEYIDSPTNGASFVVKENGIYNISYSDDPTSAGAYSGISLNASSLTTNIQSLPVSEVLIVERQNTANEGVAFSVSPRLLKGDVIRVHTDGTASLSNTLTHFSISKVGKTQGTVDVTPFVQIPQNEVEAIEALTSTSTFGSTNTGVPVLNITKNTNKGIIQVLSSAAEGTSFKVLKDCELNISATALAGGGAIMVTRNSTILNTSFPTGFFISGQHMFAGPVFGNVDTTISCNTGDVIRIQRQDNISTTVISVLLTATALSPSIATPTEQVSSDTMNFVFKATAIVDSDPVGTFNTYKKGASSQGSSILCTTAPTQSVSSMNANGVLVTANNYATAGTDALPNRFDIKIGKGLKSWDVLGYNSTGKSTEIMLELFPYSGTELYGSTRTYNETTGILTIDAGFNNSTSITNRGYLLKVGFTGAGTSGYFVFNASKSPSLVSIPNLQQRVAYLSDVKASGTGGGTATSGAYAARTLNTIQDNTGIVTSLASNQFTLPAGTYDIEAIAPAGYCNSHKIKLRNVTDSTDALMGGAAYFNASSGFYGVSEATLMGMVVLTAPKTFELQHRVETTRAGDGFGPGVAFGDNNIFTQIKITKIK